MGAVWIKRQFVIKLKYEITCVTGIHAISALNKIGITSSFQDFLGAFTKSLINMSALRWQSHGFVDQQSVRAVAWLSLMLIL